MSDPSIHAVTTSEVGRCLAILSLAFGSDPACRWVWPDPQQYLEAFPRFAEAFGGGAVARETADCYGECSGVAFWLPPGVTPDEAALMALIEETVAEAKQAAMRAIFEQLAVFHPGEPHWHLALIGVDPLQQHDGIATALLRYRLPACDEQGVPAYLEATSARSVPLYERHGFVAVGTVAVAGSPPLVAMQRAPRPSVELRPA